MSKKNKKPAAPAAPAGPLPVLHGDCFRSFLDEARSVGAEVVARREFDLDVVEYLTQKGLMDEWSKWREAKRKPQG